MYTHMRFCLFMQDQPIKKLIACTTTKNPHIHTEEMASEIIKGEVGSPRKALYCIKCKKYVPSNYFTTDDGTVSESVCNRHELEKTLETDGVRYCKECDKYIALDLFPRTGAVSYVCKKHKYAAEVVRKSKQTEDTHPGKKRRLKQWTMCWADSKTFKQASIGMSQNEIDLEIAKIDQKRTGKYRIMPIDVEKILTIDNCVVVTMQKRKNLMKMVSTHDLEAYATMIKKV